MTTENFIFTLENIEKIVLNLRPTSERESLLLYLRTLNDIRDAAIGDKGSLYYSPAEIKKISEKTLAVMAIIHGYQK